MKQWIWLRVAAILQALFALGHTIGGIPRKAIRGPQEQAVFDAMQTFSFNAMGSTRSHWDFYQGFGVMISVNLAVLAVLMWQLGNLSRTGSEAVRPLAITLLISEILTAALSWKYFFAGPIVTSVLVSLCLSIAVASSYGRARAASQVAAG